MTADPNKNSPLVAAAFLLACALVAGSWILSTGIRGSRTAERFVTVRGLAEKDVVADTVIWPLMLSANGDELGRLQSKLESDLAIVRAFLKEQGFADGDISVEGTQVNDLLMQPYGERKEGQGRYLVRQHVTVHSANVQLVRTANMKTGDLLKKEIALDFEQGPKYLFTRLNEVKPDMIVDATRNARDAAQKFAELSGSRLGKIRRASQGIFEIRARNDDEYVQEKDRFEKSVRVVTTIEYFLVD